MNFVSTCLIFLLTFGCAKASDRLVVFGDSISYGYYASASYPSLLAGSYGLKLENHSVTSTTLDSPEQIGAIRSTVFLPTDKILFSPGINDSLVHRGDPTYVVRYEGLLTEAFNRIESSGATAFVGQPLLVQENSELLKNLNVDSKVYANVLPHVLIMGGYQHIHLVESRAQFVPKIEFMHDAVHPNGEGHVELFQIFRKAMNPYFD